MAPAPKADNLVWTVTVAADVPVGMHELSP